MLVLDLAATPWPAIVPGEPLLLVPLGSTEQHGPHLPFTTDAIVAEAVCRAAAPAIAASTGNPVALAPVQAFGASGEHQAFPGTLSIGHEALRVLLVELVRSASTWARGVLLVNGHGGNLATVRSVVEQMQEESHRVTWVPCALETSSDAHAGLDETSVMLHRAPGLVDMGCAEPGNTAPLDELLPRLMAQGVRPVASTGVLGDPTHATAELGERLFAQLVDRVIQAGVDA